MQAKFFNLLRRFFSWSFGNPSIKMVLICIGVGIISGHASLLFMYGLEYLSAFFQGSLMAVSPPPPSGEHLVFGSIHLDEPLGFSFLHSGKPWLILLIPTFCGLLSGFLVYKFAPEAEGHGIDAMIKAFHHNKGKIRVRVPFIKMLASFVTLGSGGSGGREGPIALIGGGFGSWLSDRLGLRSKERRQLLLAGAAGGIGAIFRAPLGGAISAIEILYKEDLETEALLPAVVSSVTAYSTFLIISGPLFGFQERFIFDVPPLHFHPAHLLFYLVLVLACALLGRFYVLLFHGIKEKFFDKIKIAPLYKPAIGGFLIGVVALFVPQTLGMGMGYIQEALQFDPAGLELGAVIRFCLTLILLKILTVSLTIGSGGSGGVFGPSLLIGGLGGFVIGLLCYKLAPLYAPGLPLPPISAFVILGMSSFFAAVANAPLGALVMASEMTRGYALLAPLMLVSVMAMIFTRRYSIYHSQVKDKFHSPAHLGDISFDILRNVLLETVFRPSEVLTIPNKTPLHQLRTIISDDRYSFPLVVRNRRDQLAGMLSMGTIREALFNEELSHLLIVKDVMTSPVTCALDEDLHRILIKFTQQGYGRLPVVAPGEPDRVLGYVAYQEIMEAYQKEIARLKAVD